VTVVITPLGRFFAWVATMVLLLASGYGAGARGLWRFGKLGLDWAEGRRYWG
jgi:hypothetical protein